MDRRAFKIRNSKFLDFLINQAIYAVDAYAAILKFQYDETEIEACRQLIKGLLNELKFNADFSRLLDNLGLKPLFLTDVDRILRVGNNKLIIFEFKHISQKTNGSFIYIKKHVLETLQIIAKATKSQLLLVTKEGGFWFVKDITNLTISGEYRAFRLSEFQKLDNKGFLEFIRRLVK